MKLLLAIFVLARVVSGAEKDVASSCDLIVSVKLQMSETGKSDDAELLMWESAATQMRMHFLNSVRAGGSAEEFAKQYLDEALRRPASEMFKLFVAGESALFPVRASRDAYNASFAGEEWVIVSNCAAEYEIELLSNSPEARSKIHSYLVWRGKTYKPGSLLIAAFEKCVDKIEKREEMAWYGRNFLLFALVTNREDLVSGATVNNLHDRSVMWMEYLRRSKYRFRSSSIGAFWYVDEMGDTIAESTGPMPLKPLNRFVDALPFPQFDGNRLSLY